MRNRKTQTMPVAVSNGEGERTLDKVLEIAEAISITTSTSATSTSATLTNGNRIVPGTSIKSRADSVVSVNSMRDLSGPASSAQTLSLRIPMIDAANMVGLSDQTFPELLEAFRQSAKESRDPAFQMTFVDYLFSCADKVLDAPETLGIYFDVEDERPAMERQQMMREMLVVEGMKWVKRLATTSRAPYAEAQFLLAEFYGKGAHGLRVDHGRAFALYLAASKQNHPGATYRAAVCYEVGAGTKKDEARAAQFYRKSAAAGDPLAMHKYALMLLYGHLGTRRNLKEGISWLKRAASIASAACPQSLMDLARLHEKDSGCPMVIPDEGYALELYRRAAHLGHAPAQYRVGTCHEFGILGCAMEPTTALKWYAKAADQGFPDAELALSHWYLTGTPATALSAEQEVADEVILKPSEEEAFTWAHRAADRGHPKAQYTLGYYCEEGIGCEANLARALVWYRRAAEQKYHRALRRLTELKEPTQKKRGPKCIIS